jgi:hypothetical protein
MDNVSGQTAEHETTNFEIKKLSRAICRWFCGYAALMTALRLLGYGRSLLGFVEASAPKLLPYTAGEYL